jgi:hypothetical protein
MLSSDYGKTIELEFMNNNGYNNKVKEFLSKFDEFITNHMSNKSDEWFGKNIPVENILQMYKKTVCDNKIRFIISKGEIINRNNENLETTEIVKGVILECICQLKYIVFTKDSCFLHWEICTAKLHKKVSRVKKFGFIDDPNDQSDDELSDEESITFF